MDSATFKNLWVGTCATTGLAVVIALLSTVGTLPKWSVVCFIVLGGLSFSFTVIGLDWASIYPIKPKSMLILCAIWAVMGILAYASWPKPSSGDSAESKQSTEEAALTTDKPPVRNVHANKNMISMDVDTSLIRSLAEDFFLIAVLRVKDNSVDSLTDPKIVKSQAFTITGEVRTLQINFPNGFIDENKLPSSLEAFLGVIPKNIRPEQILTIGDITALGGRQITITVSP